MANQAKASQDRIAAAERQRKALELRKAGVTYDQIATQLGYADGSGAYRAIQKALADIPRDAAEGVRTMELERLDRMQLGLYEKAVKGHEGAVDRVLRIMDRRAKLLGLDAPAAGPPPGNLAVTIYDGRSGPAPAVGPGSPGRGDEAGAGD